MFLRNISNASHNTNHAHMHDVRHSYMSPRVSDTNFHVTEVPASLQQQYQVSWDVLPCLQHPIDEYNDPESTTSKPQQTLNRKILWHNEVTTNWWILCKELIPHWRCSSHLRYLLNMIRLFSFSVYVIICIFHWFFLLLTFVKVIVAAVIELTVSDFLCLDVVRHKADDVIRRLGVLCIELVFLRQLRKSLITYNLANSNKQIVICSNVLILCMSQIM